MTIVEGPNPPETPDVGGYGFLRRMPIAGAAREALHSFAAERVDVVVTDLALRDEDGYGLLRALQALEVEGGRSVPVIALTGSAMPEDRQRVSAAGFDLHLTKPVQPADLLEAVAMASSGRASEFATRRSERAIDQTARNPPAVRSSP